MMTGLIILRPHCSSNKVLNTTKPQHLGVPCPKFFCRPSCTSPYRTAKLSAESARNCVKARKEIHNNQVAFGHVTALWTCPLLAPPRIPHRIWVLEVQLPLLTFNASSLRCHACANTDPRKRAILRFSLQCQQLLPALGIPQQGLDGPGFSTSNIHSSRKEATPFFPLELGQRWAFKSHADTPKKPKIQTESKNLTWIWWENYNSEDDTFADPESFTTAFPIRVSSYLTFFILWTKALRICKCVSCWVKLWC